MNGTQMAYEARLWRENNPDMWRFIENCSLNEAQHKRRFSMRWVVDEARRKSFVDGEGNPAKVGNTLVPAFARMVVADHPEVRSYIVLNRSRVDGEL